jgi:soluble lytic murein transglycosylase-like protein
MSLCSRPRVADARQQIHGAVIPRGAPRPYDSLGMPAHNYKRLSAAAGLVVVLAFAAQKAFAPDAPAGIACVPEEIEAAAVPDPLDPQQRTLATHLSRRFQVAAEETGLAVFAAYRAAQEVGLDPLLVLAMISIESSFNPAAESTMGAKGLMQIIPRFHLAKLEPHGGAQAVLDPESNIAVGARILQEYVYRTGSLEAGLQQYNGASRDESAQYAQKVMAERSRLERVLRRTQVTALGAQGG